MSSESGGIVKPICSGYTSRGGLGRCDRTATFYISVPNEAVQFACNMHIGQVVKRWAAPPVSAVIKVEAL